MQRRNNVKLKGMKGRQIRKPRIELRILPDRPTPIRIAHDQNSSRSIRYHNTKGFRRYQTRVMGDGWWAQKVPETQHQKDAKEHAEARASRYRKAA